MATGIYTVLEAPVRGWVVLSYSTMHGGRAASLTAGSVEFYTVGTIAHTTKKPIFFFRLFWLGVDSRRN